MLEATTGVQLDDVEVISSNRWIVACRMAGHVLPVPPRGILPGTTVSVAGDRGILVVSSEVAAALELPAERR